MYTGSLQRSEFTYTHLYCEVYASLKWYLCIEQCDERTTQEAYNQVGR